MPQLQPPFLCVLSSQSFHYSTFSGLLLGVVRTHRCCLRHWPNFATFVSWPWKICPYLDPNMIWYEFWTCMKSDQNCGPKSEENWELWPEKKIYPGSMSGLFWQAAFIVIDNTSRAENNSYFIPNSLTVVSGFCCIAAQIPKCQNTKQKSFFRLDPTKCQQKVLFFSWMRHSGNLLAHPQFCFNFVSILS